MARCWLSLVSLLVLPLVSAFNDFALDCADGDRTRECQQPLKPITTVVEGSFYVAKLPCLDCPVRFSNGVFQQRKNDLVRPTLSPSPNNMVVANIDP
jgi:hypothetical protein